MLRLTFLLFALSSLVAVIVVASPAALRTGENGSPLAKRTVAPISYSVSTVRQTSRLEILERRRIRAIEEKRAKQRQGATLTRQLAPRASPIVYPVCSSTQAAGNSGFASIPGWYIPREAPYDISGTFRNVESNAACVMLCQQSSNCVGYYWASDAKSCSFRQAIPSGSPYATRATSLGVMALKGDCSTLAPQINNATVMASCCNSAGQPSKIMCSPTQFRGLNAWTFSGQRTLNGNRIPAAQGGSLKVSADNRYAACANACESYSSSHYPSSATNAGIGCVAAIVDIYEDTEPGYNCLLYSTNLGAMSMSTDQVIVSLVKGNCAQRNATNTVPGSCCDS